MKFKLIICLLLCLEAAAQKETIHLCLVTDRTNKLQLIIPQQKEEKIKKMFNTISKELKYDLKINYFGFKASQTIDGIENLGKMGTNDIVVLYYIGRGNYPNAPNTNFPILEFQDLKNTLTIDDLRGKLQSLVNKPRLTLIIADCDNSEVTRDAFSNSESDSLKNKVIEQNLPPEKNDDSLYLKKLDKTELLYFNTTLDSLYKLTNMYRMNNTDEKLSKRLNYQLSRLSEYAKYGFPKASVPLTHEFEQLPPIIDKPAFNRNFKCVVDSMYKKRSVFLPNEPLNDYLDKLLNLPLLKDDEDGRTTTTPEPTKKPFIQKLFLSQCGEIVITNGANQDLNKNADYTGYIESNFNLLLEKGKFNKIDNLTIDLLFNKIDNKNFIYGKKTNLTPCPNRSQDFKTPIYSEIPTSDDINKLFLGFIKTKDDTQKNKLLVGLRKMFTDDASITLQTSQSVVKTIAENQLKKIDINTYLTNLFAESDKIKDIQIPPSYIIRNDNFSKIINLTIVEYR